MVFKYDYPEHLWLAMPRVEALPLCTFFNVLVLLWPFFGSAKGMAGSNHTPASCLSNLRSTLEASKKQPRVWLQYVCGVTEMLLYPSFEFLWSPHDDSEMARYGFEDGSKRCASNSVELS